MNKVMENQAKGVCTSGFAGSASVVFASIGQIIYPKVSAGPHLKANFSTFNFQQEFVCAASQFLMER